MGQAKDLPSLKPFSAKVPGGKIALRAHHWRNLGRGNSCVGDRGRTRKFITCEMHLASKESGPLNGPLSESVRDTCWVVDIERHNDHGKLSKAYEASVKLVLGGGLAKGVVGPVLLMRGTCRDWEEAIVEVGECAPWGEALTKLGAELYGPEAREFWTAVRPFNYKWTWSNPAEPNCRYSELTLPGGWEFAAELDGAVATVFFQDFYIAHALANQNGCNAFILFHATKGPQVYHRNYMRDADPIDMDDWRARIIASAGEKI